MTNYQPDWIFNIALKLAVAICLGTLATALYVGVTPLTAVFRSGAAFTVFATLGWAAALMWQVPQVEEETEETESDTDPAEDGAGQESAPAEDGPLPDSTQPTPAAKETPIPAVE
ncbi:MAG: hypothetical protein D6768_00685 [Chloroflexi bacterium]|nr:MAG: hypothetical protein D6768_00685 [Chloroflexota bacterium]